MDISWRVPSLFNNDRVALRLTKLLRPYLGRNPFDAVYGAPMTVWSGGRPSLVSERLGEDLLRRYFEAYRAEGIRCSLTLTRMNPSKEDFRDAYCNLLLDMLDEYDGEAIVFNDDLAAYIRQTHPGIPLVASNIKPATDFVKGWPGCSDEYEYYMRLLEDYDRIVIRNEAALNGDMRERLRDIADRCEIVVNPRCVPDCPRCLEHYQNIEKAIEDINHKAGCYYSNDDPLVYSMALDHDQIREFASEGFTHYKIEGRNAPSGLFSKYCMNFILEKEEKAEIHKAMDNRDAIELVMLLTKTEAHEERMQLP